MYARRFLLAALALPALTTILDRLHSRVFLGGLDTEAGRADNSSLSPERFHLYLRQVGGTWTAYGGLGGKVFPATRSIHEPYGLPADVPTSNRESACWWLWLIFPANTGAGEPHGPPHSP